MKEEEDRLKVEWTEAIRKRSALQTELDKPTVSRSFDAQRKLVNEIEAAGAECQRLLVSLRCPPEGCGLFNLKHIPPVRLQVVAKISSTFVSKIEQTTEITSAYTSKRPQ